MGRTWCPEAQVCKITTREGRQYSVCAYHASREGKLIVVSQLPKFFCRDAEAYLLHIRLEDGLLNEAVL